MRRPSAWSCKRSETDVDASRAALTLCRHHRLADLVGLAIIFASCRTLLTVPRAPRQACIALSNHLIASPAPVVRARRILELGAGVGLLTLVAARLARQGEEGDEARRRFVATDIDEKVLETLQGNIRTSMCPGFAAHQDGLS